jgi:iron complex outermembrane receptor protein
MNTLYFPERPSAARLTTAVALASAITSGLAEAQAPLLEEVIVTAQKRAENLQDVPISVSALSGERLSTANLQNLEDIALYVPNLTISEAVVSTNLFIRGIGSGVNQGFEQSVGTFIDGIYMGRGFQARAPFLDVARVEVLRGPQGILFGKNTIAGALNITTARPTEQFEASVTALYEPDHGERNITAVISGPISDSLRGRVAVRDSSLDGFIKNTFTGNDDPRKDETVFRGALTWQPSDALTVNAKAETGSFDVNGRISQTSELSPGTLALIQGIDPLEDGIANETRSIGGTGPLFAPEFNKADVDNLALTIDWQIGEHTLTAVTGYSAYEYHEIVDGDFTPLNTAHQDTRQEFEQVSQELRLASPQDQKLEYMAGLYYQKADLDSVIRIDADLRQLLGAPIIGSRHNTFVQEATTMAAFVQGTWHLTDRTRITAGLRYTDEEKDVDKIQILGELGTSIPDPDTLLPALGWNNHTLADSRSETDLSPSITVQFDATESMMTYASFSRGFKGGGYDEARADGDPDLFEYDEETVEAFEIGAKMELLAGAATLNVAVFSSEFDDLQVSTFEGVNFVVGNAAKATTRGVELDGRWRVSEHLTLGGAVSFLDAEYDAFPGAACYANQSVAAGCINRAQDLSGGDLQFAPEVTANLNAQYTVPVGNSMEFIAQLDVNYTDDILLANDNDPHPAQTQESFTKIDARIFLAGSSGSWRVGLIGRNLTDEITLPWANDLPIVTNNNYFAHIDRPRSIALQAQWNF